MRIVRIKRISLLPNPHNPLYPRLKDKIGIKET